MSKAELIQFSEQEAIISHWVNTFLSDKNLPTDSGPLLPINKLILPEHKALITLEEGTIVGVINLQHFQPADDITGFITGSYQAAVLIANHGETNSHEIVKKPSLSLDDPTVVLKLKKFFPDLNPCEPLNANDFDLDHVIPKNEVNITKFLLAKYQRTRSNLDEDQIQEMGYYLRVFEIVGKIEP